MTADRHIAGTPDLGRAFAWILTAAALAVAPPISRLLWAIAPLHADDVQHLWFASLLLLGCAFAVPSLTRRRPWVGKLLLVVTALFVCELGARLALRFVIGGWPQEKLAKLAAATYPDLAVFRGHPFAQFIGKPSHTLRGNRALAAEAAFNRHGFHGPDVPLAKDPSTCRILCLGASTTASGYPVLLTDWLTQHCDAFGAYESVNLAHGFYTSAHSVVNFALTGLDYAPDYVVVHHGWNDGRARRNGDAFRGDYSHVFRPFAPPTYADWLPIRASVLYRFARYGITGRETGQGSLDAALLEPVHDELGEDLDRAAATFERNLRTIVDLAKARGIRPVLATIPCSTDPGAAFAAARPQLERLTEVVRDVAADLGDAVLLADVAAAMTGRNDLFKDLGHLTPEGVREKAERIGAVVATDLKRRR